MKTVLVADPRQEVAALAASSWARTPGLSGELLHLDPSEMDAARASALLETELPDLVIFSGAVAPELLAYARFRGLRIILVLDGAPAGLGAWDEPLTQALFLAHVVCVPGLSAPQVLETGEGARVRVVPIPERDAFSQLRALRELGATLRPEVEELPATGSTWLRLLEQAQLRQAVIEGDIREEVTTLRRLARRWVEREGGEDPLVERPVRARPRVLLVSHDLTKTGAPMALLWMLRAWLALETPWDLWVLGLDDGPMEDLFAKEVGERFRKVSTRNAQSPYGDALATIDEIQPDLILLNGSPIYQLVPLLTWKGYPLAWWYHEGLNVAKRDGHLFTTRSLEGLVRYTQGLPGRLLTASDDTVRELEKFCGAARGRVGMIPYGFTIDTVVTRGRDMRARRAELREELGLGVEDIVFVCVGSLEERKNQRRLVEAFQLVADQATPEVAARLRLLLVGNLDPDGKAPDNYHAEIERAVRPEHAEKVRILGPQPSAYPHMVAADAQVLVSTNECSPLVNIEAILLGTYVVSSRVHGIPELIEDGVRGTLVEPESVEDIAAGLQEVVDGVLNGPERLAARREAAFAFASEKHDVARVARDFEVELENLLHFAALGGGLRLLGAAANPYLERALVQRWTFVKHDVVNEGHIVRGHAHHFYDPDVRLPDTDQLAGVGGPH